MTFPQGTLLQMKEVGGSVAMDVALQNEKLDLVVFTFGTFCGGDGDPGEDGRRACGF
jgi:hypothetical protein